MSKPVSLDVTSPRDIGGHYLVQVNIKMNEVHLRFGVFPVMYSETAMDTGSRWVSNPDATNMKTNVSIPQVGFPWPIFATLLHGFLGVILKETDF